MRVPCLASFALAPHTGALPPVARESLQSVRAASTLHIVAELADERNSDERLYVFVEMSDSPYTVERGAGKTAPPVGRNLCPYSEPVVHTKFLPETQPSVLCS